MHTSINAECKACKNQATEFQRYVSLSVISFIVYVCNGGDTQSRNLYKKLVQAT